MVTAMLRSVFPNGASLASILSPTRKSVTEIPHSKARGSWFGRCWMMWRKVDPGILFAWFVGAAEFVWLRWERRSNFPGNPGWTRADDWRVIALPNGRPSLPLESPGRELFDRSALPPSRVGNFFPGNRYGYGPSRYQR